MVIRDLQSEEQRTYRRVLYDLEDVPPETRNDDQREKAKPRIGERQRDEHNDKLWDQFRRLAEEWEKQAPAVGVNGSDRDA